MCYHARVKRLKQRVQIRNLTTVVSLITTLNIVSLKKLVLVNEISCNTCQNHRIP